MTNPLTDAQQAVLDALVKDGEERPGVPAWPRSPLEQLRTAPKKESADTMLLLRLRQGPLTRDPIDRESALPSEKRMLNAEESCLRRGWAEWRDGVLYATDLGRRVPWRQPKAR